MNKNLAAYLIDERLRGGRCHLSLIVCLGRKWVRTASGCGTLRGSDWPPAESHHKSGFY